MSEPPELVPFEGNWPTYEAKLYAVFLESFVNAKIFFRGWPVRAQYRPATRGMHFGFWHVISEPPDPRNRNEEDRVPDLERCRRLRWIPWTIEQAGQADVSWWENQRRRDRHVVIWDRANGFAVVLARRNGYYMLKTAYCVSPRRQGVFEKECQAYWKGKKAEAP
jgi:hypothetical protein